MKENEPQKHIKKSLIKIGVVISGTGVALATDGILTQQGELGSIGATVGGVGVVLLLAAARRKL